MDDNDIYRVCLSTGVLTVIISQVNKPPRFFNCDAGILFFYLFFFWISSIPLLHPISKESLLEY